MTKKADGELTRRNKTEGIEALIQCSDKLDCLADVDFTNLSFRGKEGIHYLLRDIAEELRDVYEELWPTIRDANMEKHQKKEA